MTSPRNALPSRILAAFRLAVPFAAIGWYGAAQAAPYHDEIVLQEAHYYAHLYAFGDYPSTTDIDQDDLYPYGDHHSVASPATWEIHNTVTRHENAYDTYAKSSTDDANNGTVRVDVHSNNYLASSTATIVYYFTVVGPDRDYVPVKISGYGRADASSQGGFANASANLEIDYRETGHNYSSVVTEAFGNHEGGTFSDIVNFQPNLQGSAANRMVLTAEADVGTDAEPFDNSGYYGGAGAAFIDPVFTIADPALAPFYKIVIGLADVPTGPTLPVPEPASEMMMIGGLAVLAWGMRRHRRWGGLPAA